MKAFVYKIAQSILALLRRLGFDFYGQLIRTYPRRKLNSALSGKTSRSFQLGLVLDLPAAFSLSQVGRDFIDKLSQTDIPFSVLDISVPGTHYAKITENEYGKYRDFLTLTFSPKAIIQFAAGDPVVGAKQSVFFTPFWEFESGLFETRPNFFSGTRGAIVFSKFCHKFFSANAPEGYPVSYLPYPFPFHNINIDRKATREKFGIPQNAFAVFFNFDIRSGYDRKNPEATLLAFSKAFQDKPNGRLVFKISSADSAPEKMQSLHTQAEKLGLSEKLIIITDYLTHDGILALTGSCDVYLSLHRGEGLGLGMLEAMSVNVPVIATAYGGNTDFCNDTTACMVPYKLVKPKTDFPHYRTVKLWAEPDINAAADALLALYSNPDLRRKKCAAAKSFIGDFYSQENFEKELQKFLDEIGRAHK